MMSVPPPLVKGGPLAGRTWSAGIADQLEGYVIVYPYVGEVNCAEGDASFGEPQPDAAAATAKRNVVARANRDMRPPPVRRAERNPALSVRHETVAFIRRVPVQSQWSSARSFVAGVIENRADRHDAENTPDQESRDGQEQCGAHRAAA
jgi:hypothetical protein